MNANVTIPPCCQTCAHWDRRFPENQQLGVCRRMGVSLWKHDDSERGRAHVSVTTNPDVVTDVAMASTREGFGCRLHSDYVMMTMAGTL